MFDKVKNYIILIAGVLVLIAAMVFQIDLYPRQAEIPGNIQSIYYINSTGCIKGGPVFMAANGKLYYGEIR